MAGPDAWEADETVRRAIEIRDGVIRNPAILSFQHRAAAVPAPARVNRPGRSLAGAAPASRTVRPMTRPMIRTEGLTKTFVAKKRTVEAVRGLDLTVEPGEMVALLGPNGAGKSTTLRMLTTLLAPTSGRRRVAGYDVVAEPGRRPPPDRLHRPGQRRRATTSAAATSSSCRAAPTA